MEQEWIESRGECRQLVAWSGVLAKHAGARTATLVARDGASHSFTADGTAELPQATSVESFVYDPAPSLRAARLVADWCHVQRLTALSAGSQFLTAAHGAASPLAQMFRVLDTLPFDIPRIKDWLRSRNIGRLEIKPREIGITPEKLRPQLQLRGNHAAVLLLYAHLGRPQALLAERCA
jgi:hypothetical protein